MMTVLVWSALAALFFLFELGHPGLFFCLSFCCGAVTAACIACIAPELLVWQGVGFVVGSGLAFLVLRRWVTAEQQHRGQRTNVDALQGRHGIVLVNITPLQSGLVKIGGETWAAVSAHGEFISVDSTVEVLRVQGVHLVVVPLCKKGLL